MASESILARRLRSVNPQVMLSPMQAIRFMISKGNNYYELFGFFLLLWEST